MKKRLVLIALILAVFCAGASLAEGTPGVGDIVTFGCYEQDNDGSPEPIEWIVLDVQDGRALLLSRYGLDAMEYNTEYEETTWETSLVRRWLNDDFLNSAFSNRERAAVLTTLVDNSAAQGCTELTCADQNDTEDRVFLLSYHEAFDLYFPDNKSRICAPTPYAVARGAWDMAQFVNPDRHLGLWWLRSFDADLVVVTYVDFDGTVDAYFVVESCVCLRPALWLDLNADVL